MPERTETDPIRFKIGVDGTSEKPVDATLYVFNAQEELIASGPLRDGVAQIDVNVDQLRRARLFVAPTLPEGRAKKPTLKTMALVKAYEPSWRFEANRRVYDLKPIPELLWPFWLWCSCRVRGRVIKVETLGGVTYERPVCHARVHICEVDRLPWILSKLPDPIILRLRDELLIDLDRPFPPNPNPPDPPFRIDPGVIDFVDLGKRAANIFGQLAAPVLNPQPEPPRPLRRLVASAPGIERVSLNPQPLPPRAAAGLTLELRSVLLSESPRLVRDALITNVDLIKPFWCRLLWLDAFLGPALYGCEELDVIETGDDGRFDTTILYPCNDHPDLYFWVEYSVNGVWETVYHPSLRCSTYWNYACGSEITLYLHDPRVHGCGKRPDVTGNKVVVKTIGRQVSMGEIYGDSPVPALKAKEGQVKEGWIHPTKASPFGAELEPRVDFGSGLKGAGITHYRWSYRTLGSSNEGDWRVVNNPGKPVSRHYRVSTPPGAPTAYSSVQIGPDSTLSDFFTIIDPTLPANGEDWEVLDEGFDLASAYFDTAALAPGKYELKLELFKNVGGVMQRVDLTAESVELYEITDPAPLVEGSYATTVPTADRVLLDPVTSHVVAYRLVLHVDNRECFGTINDVTVNGTPAGRCGFLEYNALTDDALVSFRASHPANFASFGFRLVRVATQVDEGTVGGLVDDAADNGFLRTGDTFRKELAIDVLMSSGLDPEETPCTRAAFAESLHVAALATNGYDRLAGLDAPRPEDPAQVDLRAFAIAPA